MPQQEKCIESTNRMFNQLSHREQANKQSVDFAGLIAFDHGPNGPGGDRHNFVRFVAGHRRRDRLGDDGHDPISRCKSGDPSQSLTPKPRLADFLGQCQTIAKVMLNCANSTVTFDR